MDLTALSALLLDPARATDLSTLATSTGRHPVEGTVTSSSTEGVIIKTDSGPLLRLAAFPGARMGRRARLSLDPSAGKLHLVWLDLPKSGVGNGPPAQEHGAALKEPSPPVVESAAGPRTADQGVPAASVVTEPVRRRPTDDERSAPAKAMSSERQRLVLKIRLPNLGAAHIQAESAGSVLRTVISVEDPALRLRLGARMKELGRRLEHTGFERIERPRLRPLEPESKREMDPRIEDVE